ncbi:BZ3500_MvSof-1268-A1-R1_Chr1-2g01358 [Microbotryum saponariae]|uniref:BZ3500_MvSof-1268-A1-R1_Chr1-2g01358 protein n=1 Tax=Microbotryum saponariae TaxID=289078 RepID=A0A2X0KED5_9BASI|nr:BZ3500_MvSof-1268-A1-R1_Chr1-2g01358 [Microbotryum saponariae]SCZ97196.1 BZ3501_MvSof-1269-A2-R1_Chr1-2g00957 [Microbotryum saponariae]
MQDGRAGSGAKNRRLRIARGGRSIASFLRLRLDTPYLAPRILIRAHVKLDTLQGRIDTLGSSDRPPSESAAATSTSSSVSVAPRHNSATVAGHVAVVPARDPVADKTRTRVQLVAALLGMLPPPSRVAREHPTVLCATDYDQPDLKLGARDPTSKAQQSALLEPFRHLMLPPPPSPAPSVDVAPPAAYTDDGAHAATPGSVPVLGVRDEVEERPSDSTSQRLSDNFRSFTLSDRTNREGGPELDDEAVSRLNEEWGLDDVFSRISSGEFSIVPTVVPLPPTIHTGAPLPFPKSPQVASWLTKDVDETRSMPDLDQLDSPLPDPSTSKFRILERKPGDGSETARPRTQSLGVSVRASLGSLSLPTLENVQTSTSSSGLVSSRLLSDLCDGRLSNFSLAKHSEQVANPRRISSLPGAVTVGASSSSGDRLSRLGHATQSAGSSDAAPADAGSPASMTSSFAQLEREVMGDYPAGPILVSLGTTDAVPAGARTFTSRFDPAYIEAQRLEAEQYRPQFANKLAGEPPKVVLMPAPLAGQPLAMLLAPPRAEGPDAPEEIEDEPVPRERIERPAGALYGRSLMDVMEDKKRTQKSKTKSYVPGADGRRAMMDWRGTIAGQEMIAKQQRLSLLEGVDQTASLKQARKSMFGRDLLYERDMELIRAEKAAEEAERLEAEREEQEAWEKFRIREEEKQRMQNEKLALIKQQEEEVVLEAEDMTALAQKPRSPTSETHEVLVPSPVSASTVVSSSRTLAPPIDFLGLGTTTACATLSINDWLPPTMVPSSPASSAASSRSSHDSRRGYTSSSAQALDWRNAIMQGTMSPFQAAAATRSLDLRQGANADDDRPMGERLSSQPGMQPPAWTLDFGEAGDDGDDELIDEDEYFDYEDDEIDYSEEEGYEFRVGQGRKSVNRPPSIEDNIDVSDTSSRAGSDDEPLALRVNAQVEDEDVPLGLKAAANVRPSQVGEEEEDDIPLALTAPAMQMRDQAAYEREQHRVNAARAQSQMYLHAQARQSAAYFAMHQQLEAAGEGMEIPGFGGTSTSVDRWRQSVEN